VTNPVIFGEHDERVVNQLKRCIAQEDGSQGVLCADGHFGYSAPIGGVIAYREHVSPAAVGYDIGCGNLAALTDLMADDLRPDLAGVMDRIYSEVSFGMGRRDGNADPDHWVLEDIRNAEFEPQRKLADDAAKQLGTVGAGNHYVDLFSDEQGRVWVGVHFGSRGFGHKTASGFLAMAAEEKTRRKLNTEANEAGRMVGDPRGPIEAWFDKRGKEGEMESAPDVLNVGSDLGQAYLVAMELAGNYAHAGREVVVDQVLGILGAGMLDSVHNHHNYAWSEPHGDGEFYVVRKGATPAFPGQRGFVGATMGEPAVILEGVESDLSKQALYSTVHGAGRAMSRTKAAGKQRKRWACQVRDCDYVQAPRTPKPEACPDCGGNVRKVWVKESEGAIDWEAALLDLKGKGIELRGAAADEAPGAYKRLDAVLAAHEGTVRILHTLTPMGVAMAGPDTRDDYKD
jgi:tRNA-splicing ligase RtcB